MKSGGVMKDGKWVTKARLLRKNDEINFQGVRYKVKSTTRARAVVEVLIDDMYDTTLLFGAEDYIELLSRDTQMPDKPKKAIKKGQLKLL
jgi:hypothetical protein